MSEFLNSSSSYNAPDRDAEHSLDLGNVKEPEGCPRDSPIFSNVQEPDGCPPVLLRQHKVEYREVKMADGSTKRLVRRNFRIYARDYHDMTPSDKYWFESQLLS